MSTPPGLPKIILSLMIPFTECDHPNITNLLLMTDIVKSTLEDEDLRKVVVAEINEKNLNLTSLNLCTL